MPQAKVASRKADANKDEQRIPDDGQRYTVLLEDGFRVYPGNGVPLQEAIQLAKGLAVESKIARLENGQPGEIIARVV